MSIGLPQLPSVPATVDFTKARDLLFEMLTKLSNRAVQDDLTVTVDSPLVVTGVDATGAPVTATAGSVTLKSPITLGLVNPTAATTEKVTVVDDVATNATMYPVWVTAAGDVPEYISTTGLTWNPSTGLLGVGTPSPNARLTLNENAVTTPPTLPAASILHIVGADAAGPTMFFDAIGSSANFSFRAAAGTLGGGLSAVTNDANLASFNGYGYGATGYIAGVKCAYGMRAAETWTDTANGTYHLWRTTPKLGTTLTERMRLTDAGVLALPGAGGAIQLAGATGIVTATSFTGAGTGLTGTAASLTAGTATNAVNVGITDDNATAAAMYPVWVTAAGDVPEYISTTKMAFNPSTGYLGLGIAVMDAPLTLNRNTAITTPPTLPTGNTSSVHVMGPDGSITGIFCDAFGSSATFATRAALGTFASPSQLAANSNILGINGYGRSDVGYVDGVKIAYGMRAAEAWTATANGTYHLWYTTPIGGTTIAERMRLDDAGMLTLVGLGMTAGTMTKVYSGAVRTVLHRFDFTNAMITALGAVGTGNITVGTLLPAYVVKNVYLYLSTPDTSANALTASVGRTAATYVDYIAASNMKAGSNVMYGDVAGERGANLTGYDVPSVTSTTEIKMHLIKTTTNLNTVTGCAGIVFVETNALV